MMTLTEWLTIYLKYKDSIHKRIENIELSESGNLIVTKKDSTKEIYTCMPDLNILNLANLGDAKIVCLNKKANVDWLINNWELVKDKKITIIFVNIEKAESWSINTYMHHNVTEKPALKTGLLSLFSTVPEST